MRRIPAFVYGHVLSALLIGLIAGAFLDLKAVLIFSSVMAGCALASAIICWMWPGFSGPGWQLWIAGVIGNPMFLVAGFFAYQELDCLTGAKTGWSCLFSDVYPMLMGACLVPPLLGLVVRWLPGLRPKS